jgi:glycosyltransferase involved in cell wall biosynthesis
MIKILFIVPYPQKESPSQRFRFEQYLDFLKENNIDYKIAPFLDLETWKIFYQPKKHFAKAKGIIKGIIRRFSLLKDLDNYDIVFIHREACPVGPAYFEKLIAKKYKKKIVFDFDDAIWLPNTSKANNSLSWLKKPEKTFDIISYAKYISAGNKYLADFSKKINPNVKIIPTTIDTDYHKVQQRNISEKKVINIGWTGSATTIEHYKLSYDFLSKINDIYGDQVMFTVISNIAPENAPFKVNFLKWQKDTEISDLNTFDIGIMPLPNDKWAEGKCGFKGLQYMSLAIPAVMSPVGVNKDIITDGENGFLPNNDAEWVEILTKLIDDANLRMRIGNEGAKNLEKNYSVNANKIKYLELIQEVYNS